MLPIAIILGQNVFGAFFSLLSRRLSVTLPNAQLQVAAVFFVLTYMVALPAGLLSGNVYVADLLQWLPLLSLAAGAAVLNGVSLLFIFKHMDAAMGSLLTTINIVLAVAAAMYVLGEQLGVQELAGATVVLAAVVYALSVHVSRNERRNWTLGILFTLCSAVSFATAAVIEKYLLGRMGASSYLVWEWGLQVVLILALSLCIGRKHFKKVLTRANAPLLIGAGITRGSMGVCFVYSLVILKSLSVAVVLAGLRPLFVAFLGAWVLRERKFLRRKIIASIVAALGVAIMFW